MKKFYLLIVGFVAMFGLMFSVNAAQSATLTCDKTTIGIGESTNCYVTIETEANVTDTVITLRSSQYLIVSSPVANTKAGWAVDAAKTKTSSGEYAFANSTSGGVTGATQVFSFTVTLSEKAKNLAADDNCGQLCIGAVTFNNGTATMGTIIEGTGTCFAPTIREEECTGDSCNPKNPETGAFMNYLIIAGVGVAAIAVILIVRKTTKFYRV